MKLVHSAVFAFATAVFFSVTACANLTPQATAQAQGSDDKEEDKGPFSSSRFAGLELRNIGPAFMAGRIADIAIQQDNPSTWVVGVGSGGVWKTENAGTTWTPIFDDQGSYSIGSVAIDPASPDTIWVGTGENVGGRHVGFGDGVYRSRDGGATWENLGLKNSEHISTIIIHPEDPNTLWIAAQGPLWSKGGDRGLYKTTDGGETWKNVLSAGEWTGVTDVVIDPTSPDILYAATWQRHRTVAAYVGGGEESGLHKSTDGGETWEELTEGLPEGNMGKIGLAISPQKPNVVYAAIEMDRREGGTWKTINGGMSWEKTSDMVGAGTGPHYYQELYASPHKYDRIYMVSNYSQVSDDGGKTWRPLNDEYKHVDDHAIAFHPTDPDYIIVGSDGGLYESVDGEKTWRFFNNMPITQFYKVAVDDAEPFYNVYGGTQDNNSQGGPSRTDNLHGIRNSDWFITLFADGHQSATEPGNPDIMYAEWQEGNLTRVDRTTGEVVHIQPQAAPGEPLERFNWDAPILVSQHDPKRIYFASYRLWRSDNRGDKWTAISGDLTRNEDRMQLPVQGRKWSWDAGWDYLAMSQYNTITSIAESPIDENILYVGTDDGIIQATSDGGQTWTSTNVSRLPGVPDRAFVNDIRADLHDPDTVYVALDNHKYGDFKPYLFKSTNRGRTWRTMVGDLPDRHLVWRIVQDHKDRDLFFLATEFGLFFTPNAGANWIELEGGAPTIAFRDVTIQRREDDVVGASFGRSFFILDDLSPLRDLTETKLENEPMLFPGRRAWWYIEQHPLAFSEQGSQGHGYYRAPNPPFGAVFTYYLPEGLKSLEEQRQAAEKEKAEANREVAFPGYLAIEKERREQAPQIILVVRDSDGNEVRRLTGPAKQGFHRVAWDLRFPAMQALTKIIKDEDADPPQGFLVAPGDYTVTLYSRVRGETTELVGPQSFEVTPLREGALPGADTSDVVAFWERAAAFQRSVSAAVAAVDALGAKADLLQAAMERSRSGPSALDGDWKKLRDELYDIEARLRGDQSMAAIGYEGPATIESRLGKVMVGVGLSTYGPTDTHKEQLTFAETEFANLRQRINALQSTTIPAFEQALIAAGAPWTPGADIPAVD